MRGCAAIRRRILLAVDGRLPLEERFQLDEHVARCEECARYQDLQQAIDEGLSTRPVPEVREQDLAGALGRIHAGIAGAPAPVAAAPRRTWRVPVALAAAGLLVVSVVSFWPEGQVSPAEDLVQVSGTDVARPAAELRPADVQVAVEAALAAAFGPTRHPAEAARAFDLDTRGLRRDGWPLLRYVEDALGGGDARIAGLAAAYLGQRGDGRSAACLVRALRDPARAGFATDALSELGDEARRRLVQAFHAPGAGEAVVEALVRVGGVEVAELFESRLQRPSTPAGERVDLVRGLERLGGDAVEPLLRLLADPSTSRPSDPERLGADWETLLADSLRGTGARDEFARVLAERSHDHDTDTLLRAAAWFPTPEVWAFLEELAGSRRTRGRALATLVQLGGPRTIASLVSLEASGRVPRHELVSTLVEVLEQGDASRGAALEFTRLELAEAGPGATERWLELLFETEHPGAGPALAHLAVHGGLPSDEAQWAALAVGDFESRDGARLLADGFSELPLDARRLRAAVLITLHRVLGDEEVEDVLGDHDDRTGFRLTTALRSVRDRGAAVGLHRVVRALDEVDGARRPSLRASRP